jgi:hypothetical protein
MTYYILKCSRCKKETKHLVYSRRGDNLKLKCVVCRKVLSRKKNLHSVKHKKFKEKRNLGPIQSLLMYWEEKFGK